MTQNSNLIDRFKEDISEQIRALSAYFSEPSFDETGVQEIAHRLAGGAGQLGLRRVALLASFIDLTLQRQKKAETPLSSLERHCLVGIGPLLAASSLNPRQTEMSAVLVGFEEGPMEQVANTLDALEVNVEIASDPTELLDYLRRNDQGLLVSQGLIAEAMTIANPLLVITDADAEPSDPAASSPLCFDSILVAPLTKIQARLVLGGISVPPTGSVAFRGWPAALSSGLEGIFQRLNIRIDASEDAALLIERGQSLSFVGHRLTLPDTGVFDPQLAIRLAIRALRALERQS